MGQLRVDPVSGNEIPPGATASEVRDDIDIKASEHEYIIPANVVRFLGLDKIEKMVSKAQEQLTELEGKGRIGGEPVDDEDDDELPFPKEELVGFASGGMVDGTKPEDAVPGGGGFDVNKIDFRASNTLNEPGMGFNGVRRFKDGRGQTVYVPFFNGSPLFSLPEDYTPMSDAVTTEAPDPNQEVSQYRSPAAFPAQNTGTPQRPAGVESGRDRSTSEGHESPLAGDPNKWTPQDFITYGRTNDGPAEKAALGMISMMPAGGLFFRHREKYLDRTTAELLDKMLETGQDLQGKPLTPELRTDLISTKEKLAGDLSRESGVAMNPIGRITEMIDRFSDFVTGRPSTPRAGTSMLPGRAPNPANPTTSVTNTGTQGLGVQATKSDNDRPSNAGQTSTGTSSGYGSGSTTNDKDQASKGFNKGGLITRRK